MANSHRSRALEKHNAGFSLVELLTAISIIGILTMIAIPNYVGQRTLAYNSTAESMAKNFKICQGAYREINDAYATNIRQLLLIDKNLLDTPGLTYLWITAQPTDYLFNVQHERGWSSLRSPTQTRVWVQAQPAAAIHGWIAIFNG